MTIEQTSQGFLCYELVGVGIYARLHQKQYIGYTKREAVAEFSAELDNIDDKGEYIN